MKYLINQNFKAIRKGEFVKASFDAGEFIFDSEDFETLSVATLLEIAKKNGAQVPKSPKADIAKKLNDHLETLEIPIMSERPQSEIVAEIVAAGVAADKDDDTMLIEIVQAGIKFKQAGKLFKQAMEEGGFRITAKDRKKKGREILVDAEFAPESYEQLQEMVERLTEEVPDTTTSQANAIIRGYAKEFEIELPKPPKKSTGGIKAKVMDFLVGKPSATQDEMVEFISQNVKDEQVEKYAKAYSPYRDLANRLVPSS